MFTHPRICALFLLPVLAAGPAPAMPLDLAAAEHLALSRDQSLDRLMAEADAQAERAIADGQLPDPELSFGYQNLPIDGFSPNDEMMTMLMVGVRQQFPAGRSRHLARDRGALQSEAVRAERDRRALEVSREVRRAWLDWRYTYRASAVARDAEAHFDELTALMQRRVAAGTARQRDLSQARLELAALSERIIEFDVAHAAAAAELGRWIGEPVTGRTPGAGDDWQAPDRATLRAALPAHPALQALERQREAGRVATDLARQAYRPTWMVELGYGHRRASDMATGDRLPDMVSGMVSLNLPLFTGQRQDRRLQAAQHEQDAAAFAHADMLRQLDGALERQWALFTRLDELEQLYRDDLLPEAEQTVLTTDSAYRSDRATFDELIRARVDALDYQLRALRVARSRDDARIELRYLSGE